MLTSPIADKGTLLYNVCCEKPYGSNDGIHADRHVSNA